MYIYSIGCVLRGLATYCYVNDGRGQTNLALRSLCMCTIHHQSGEKSDRDLENAYKCRYKAVSYQAIRHFVLESIEYFYLHISIEWLLLLNPIQTVGVCATVCDIKTIYFNMLNDCRVVGRDLLYM
jgi:hypothetical protein